MRWTAAWILVLCSSVAFGVAPTTRWFTLETEHFYVHYHEGPGQAALAQRVARTCEAAHAVLTPRLLWAPTRKTEVVLTDDVDSPNGSANTYLRPVMTLYAEVPDDVSVLNDYDDYLWTLIVHEYSHILHLDNVSGIPSWFNAVFGKLLVMNALMPRWYIEGLATFEESSLSSAGRLRSSLFEMWLRATVLDGKPFTLAESSNNPVRWPRGNLAYLYGGHFLRFIAQTAGEDGFARFNSYYGAKLLPYSLNVTAQDAWGVTFVQLYEAWQKSLAEQFQKQLEPLRAIGLTELKVLTREGEGTDQARFTPDGSRIFYVEVGPNRRPAIRSMNLDGSDNRHEVRLWADALFALSPDKRHLAFASTDIYEQYYVYDDLYEVDLQTRRTEALSHGLRATEPAYSQDGARIAFVGRAGGGRTYLGVLDRAQRTVRRLFDASVDERVFTPVFSPDGEWLVFSQQSQGARHIRRIHLRSRRVQTIVDHASMNLQPRFADANTLVFTSDRSGIYNLYALDLRSFQTNALTNVATGALRPDVSPDGKLIAFTHYSSRGNDIAVVSPSQAPTAPLPDRAPRPAPQHQDDPSVTYPVQPYSAARTLLPQYWLPFALQDPMGVVLGVKTGGYDITGRQSWNLAAGYGLGSREPTVSGDYSFNLLYPVIGISASTGLAQAPGFPLGFYDRHYSLGAAATFPYDSIDSSMSVSVGYNWRYIDPRYDVHLEPDSPAPTLPRRGSVGAVSIGWSWSNARRWAFSISPEEGHGLALAISKSARIFGGTFDFSTIEARYQGYLHLPWARHHVLAARFAGGAALGDVGIGAVYTLGGISLNDPILQLFRNQRFGSGFLRGYPVGAFAGNSYALGTLEYRFPVTNLDLGAGTLPLYLRRLSGSAFADVATIGDSQLRFSALRPSVGLELRTELTAVYGLSTELRLGLARGLSYRGIWDAYLAVGSSF